MKTLARPLNDYLENAIETFLCFFFVQFRAKDKQKSMSKDDLMDNPGSPYIDVEALSDEDSTQSQKLCTDQAEDQRVLTLAEQFLAAMPARIKNDQGDEVMQWEECSCYDASQSDDLGIESMGDDFDFDFNVADESTYHCGGYRYVQIDAGLQWPR